LFVIPGWSEGPDPESRDSGFAASRRPGMTSRNSQLALPGLADQALPKAAVRLAGHEFKSGVLVDPARGDQDALGPQRDLAIAAGPREGDAFGHQPPAETLSTSGRIDQQQPQFCDVIGMPDQKYRADRGAVDVRNPAAFARHVERGQEFCRDLGYQRFEPGVEAVF